MIAVRKIPSKVPAPPIEATLAATAVGDRTGNPGPGLDCAMKPTPITHATSITEGTAAPSPSPSTLGAMLLDAAARYSGVALEYSRAGRRVSITFPQLGSRVAEIARGLMFGIRRMLGRR
jgi:hypothetical protein